MTNNPSILEQFRSFYFQNSLEDLEKAIEYFAVFGGMGWSVDMSKSLEDLIENKVLKNYTYIHSDITKKTRSEKTSHSMLSAIAVGDGRVHSALKRARVSRVEGEEALRKLCEKNLLNAEFSLETPVNSNEKIDEKLNFNTPFIRFWFAFVSPYYKSIKKGDFKETKKSFANRKSELFDYTFRKLANEVIKKRFESDAIVKIGSYWDRESEIEILAKTKSEKIIVGVSRYSKLKTKKTTLTKLHEQCNIAELTPDIFILVSKSGFSSELIALKGENLKLISLKDFKTLVEDLSQSDLIECEGKRY